MEDPSRILELDKLILFVDKLIYEDIVDGDECPNLDKCSDELRVLVDTYVALSLEKINGH